MNRVKNERILKVQRNNIIFLAVGIVLVIGAFILIILGGNKSVNDKDNGKVFKSRFVDVVAYVSAQQENTDNTKFTVSLDKDEDIDVTNFRVYYKNKAGTELSGWIAWTVNDGDTFQIYWDEDGSHVITKVTYTAWNTPVTVLRDELPDYFKIGSEDIRVFKVK